MVVVGIVPALALILLTIYVLPESPEWLQMTSPHNDIESISSNEKEALLSANNSNEDGNNKNVDKSALQHMNPVTAPFLQISSIMKLTMSESRYFKPLLLTCLIGIANVLGGGTISMFELDYLAPPIFTTTSASSVIYVGIVHLLGVCAGIPLIDTVGRRPLLFIGLFGIFVTSFVLGILVSISPTTAASSFTTVLFLIYMFLYQIGPQATFFVLSSEILPTKIRAISLCICYALLYFVDSLLLVFYTSVTNRAVWFFLWSIGSLISGILLLLYLPIETKGLSLSEIEEKLRSANANGDKM